MQKSDDATELGCITKYERIKQLTLLAYCLLFTINQKVMLVMEYLPGGDLRNHLLKARELME